MKKALIIVYYWPPTGGAGVQRWVKLVQHLPEFGWEPIIYTPENPDAPLQDETLLKEIDPAMKVIKTPIWEPYSLYKKFTGKKSEEKVSPGVLTTVRKRSFTEKMSVWVRGNFFIPDARVFWVKPSIKYLTDYLQKEPVDAIITTGPPHSMHLIGLGLRKKLNIPWVADFRDPWTKIHYHSELMLGNRARKKHEKQEAEVLQKADHVVTASYSMERDFSGEQVNGITTVTNGFEPA